MRKNLCRCFVLLLLCLLLTTTVYADMGPHFSVKVFVEMPEGRRPFYATLLSEAPGTGPCGLWEGTPRTEEEIAALPMAGQAPYRLASWEDPDGFYFLDAWFYSADGSFAWGYMPPDVFKILLWFPDTGELICSERLSRFAFDSVFRATLADGALTVTEDRDLFGQLLGFLARLAVTLVLEIGLAFVFGYGAGFLCVLFINLITQIGLNVILAFCVHGSGSGGFFFYGTYLILELIVFFVEWIYYLGRLPETDPDHPGKFRVFAYALLANALSFGAGILLNIVWPMAF
jgi:hypothetical protein